jgi:polyphosphate kinase 2
VRIHIHRGQFARRWPKEQRAMGRKDKQDKQGKQDKQEDQGKPSTQAKPGRNGKLSRADYERHLEALSLELNDMARWLQHTGRRVVVVIEGRDTAGKGGVISAISDTLSPRQCHVVALPKPSEREKTQWYFQRHVAHLPAAGEIVLFDRSWYNRAGVEPVMGFCTAEQTEAFLKQAPVFEQLLVDDGILLMKYWLTVDQALQEERFAERVADPLKRWKLSPIDLSSRQKYADYTAARHKMLAATHTRHAPWTLVDFNDQRLGRLTMIRHLLDQIPDHRVPDSVVPFPALGHAPQVEAFGKGPKPIKPFAAS